VNGVKKRLIYARRAVGIIDLSTENITLDNGCFYMSSITGVILPPTITSLGQLTTLYFGAGMFQSCTGITSLTLPNSLTSIGANAFQSCTGITNLTLPNSLISIGVDAFRYFSGITSLTLPNSLTSIGINAFTYCTGITSLTVPQFINSNSVIANNTVFAGCSNVNTLNILSGYTGTYNDWKFSAKLALTNTTADVLAQSMINISAGTVGNIKVIHIGALNKINLLANGTPLLITTMNSNLLANYKQLNAVASTTGYIVGTILLGSTTIGITAITSGTRLSFASRVIPAYAIGTIISEV